MTSRLDRLISLLDSGSTSQVRQTAASQIGGVARRFWSTTQRDDRSKTTATAAAAVKQEKQDDEKVVVQDERPAVTTKDDSKQNDVVKKEEEEEEEDGVATSADHSSAVASNDDTLLLDGWPQTCSLLRKLAPLLASKKMETRLAAVEAIEGVVKCVPVWVPTGAPKGRGAADNKVKSEDGGMDVDEDEHEEAAWPQLDIYAVLATRSKLVASSGQEFAGGSRQQQGGNRQLKATSSGGGREDGQASTGGGSGGRAIKRAIQQQQQQPPAKRTAAGTAPGSGAANLSAGGKDVLKSLGLDAADLGDALDVDVIDVSDSDDDDDVMEVDGDGEAVNSAPAGPSSSKKRKVPPAAAVAKTSTPTSSRSRGSPASTPPAAAAAPPTLSVTIPEPSLPRKIGRPTKAAVAARQAAAAAAAAGGSPGAAVPAATSSAPTVLASSSSSVAAGAAAASASSPINDAIFDGLSGRQVLVLKRKIKSAGLSPEEAAEEAMRMRLGVGPSSAGITPMTPAVSTTTSATPGATTSKKDGYFAKTPSKRGSTSNARGGEANGGGDVKLEGEANGVKTEQSDSDARSGGAIRIQNPPTTSSQSVDDDLTSFFRTIPTDSDEWIWQAYADRLALALRDPAWEVRHSSALALRDLLRLHGSGIGMRSRADVETNERAHERALIETAHRIVETLLLDRFGDFVGDQVVAPVREAASQTLASVMVLMSPATLSHLHAIVQEMIRQSNASDASAAGYVWEVRHAGLLGLKYEVAVRSDYVTSIPEDGKRQPLIDVVKAAMLGLADRDDDVRGVSAAALTPVANVLAAELADDVLRPLLTALWDCFSISTDDLGTSVGSVMDLLGQLLITPRVIELYSAIKDESSTSISRLVPRLYPFFRHTIPRVRLAVVSSLLALLTSPSLSKDWADERLLHLLFRNLVLEEREDIRRVSQNTWRAAITLQDLADQSRWIETHALPHLALWLNIVMAPIADGLTKAAFAAATKAARFEGGDASLEAYDVDKHMLACDLAIVPYETILRNRIEAIAELARIGSFDQSTATMCTLISGYILSSSAYQLTMVTVLAQEWMYRRDERLPPTSFETASVKLGELQPIIELLTKTIESTSLPMYYELQRYAVVIQREATAISHVVVKEKAGKKRKLDAPEEQPFLTLVKAETFLDKTNVNDIPASLRDRFASACTALARFRDERAAADTHVVTAAAGALIAMRVTPPRLNPLIQGIMRGIKGEDSLQLQTRAAQSLARLVANCLDPGSSLPSAPPSKIIGNLATYLCQDSRLAPQIASHPDREGIHSLQILATPAKAEGEAESSVDDKRRAIMSRGAGLALRAIIDEMGPDVLDRLPRLSEAMSGPLQSKLVASRSGDVPAKGDVQGIVDALTVIQSTAGSLPSVVKERVLTLMPLVVRAIHSDFAILRYNAARCLSILGDCWPADVMRVLVNDVVPMLGDIKSVVRRQGAIEAIALMLQRLQLKILPYVLFLVVPVLGRMSDPDENVRTLATSTFADLIKMVPLEEGIPEAEGFSAEESQRREHERQFLMQLLDNKRVQPYEIPVTIKADLRPYQKDGVSWLAFLAKYQLHGVLCDDMGLGKSLQTICIMVSKHRERQQAGLEPLPSLIVCPPTLIGHWYHEILKFSDDLKPFQYFGNAGQRESLRRAMKSHDVIVTSYEIIRSDIDTLGKTNWLYCVLDEGHAIKNGRSKLTLAVKALKAMHRLVLSGTPIQNNVLELWSLFDFLMPGFLGTEKQFNEKFSRPILANRQGKATPKQKEAAALALEALHKQVLPFLLRRLKEDVLQDLPPKIIQDYYCDLSAVQKYLYEDFASSKDNKEVEAVVKAEREPESKDQKHVFQTLQFLRKLCNHPLLALNLDNKRYSETVRKVVASSSEPVSKALLDISHAPKLQALQQILLDCGIGTDAKEEVDDLAPASQHRVLVFAQTKQMLDIVENLLFERNMPSVSYMRLDGSTDTLQRHSIVQTFNADPSIDVLLLTTAVGGLGLTLTGADTVVFLDHDWNPMKDLQAMDRAHRIGQKKVVNVYRLITKDTLEEKIMGLQRFKLNIASSVITQQNAALSTMNTDQVLDLFTAGPEAPAKKEAATPVSKMTQSNVLEGWVPALGFVDPKLILVL